jgi:hypothetical protein
MSTTVASVPQPLNGAEIKKGIAVRMAASVPEDQRESIIETLVKGLGMTCLLVDSVCYSKFRAEWTLTPFDKKVAWWVTLELEDYGRITKSGIGRIIAIPEHAETLHGTIEAMPPDRFRRETDQPIPKPTEIKAPEPEQSTMSRAARGRKNKAV